LVFSHAWTAQKLITLVYARNDVIDNVGWIGNIELIDHGKAYRRLDIK
jgi:hypothetical protein